MILIKKFPAPSDLETLKKEAEEQGLSDKDGYAKLRNPLKTQVRNLLMQEDLANQEGDFQQNCIEQLHIWENEADPSFECRLNKSCSFLTSAEISKNMVLVDIELDKV